MKLLLGKSQIALRKCKGRNSSLTAGQLKQQGSLERLIHHDGYKFLRALGGSAPYFEKAKKDLFAMIRQLGPATLFCSFSSAETKWMHLLKILGKLVDQRNYTGEELENLNWEEKCSLRCSSFRFSVMKRYKRLRIRVSRLVQSRGYFA